MVATRARSSCGEEHSVADPITTHVGTRLPSDGDGDVVGTSEGDSTAVPELVGIAEIADILAVSRQRVQQLTRRKDFPPPVARLSAGSIWTRTSLDDFIAEWREGKPDLSMDLAEIDAFIDVLQDLRARLATADIDAESRRRLTNGLSQLRHRLRTGVIADVT
jgi:hypothetical protein